MPSEPDADRRPLPVSRPEHPMSDFSKLGEEHIKPSKLVRDIPIGVVRILLPSAMLVDVDRRCWLDPDAEAIGGPDWFPSPSSSSRAIEVRRLEEGFEVGRRFLYGYQWARAMLPVRLAGQFPFLEVIGVYEAVARD